MAQLSEAKGPPISLSIYTKFVVTVSCFVETKERREICYGKRKSSNRNPLLSCAFADPAVLSSC